MSSSDDDSAEAKAFVGWVKAVGVSCNDVADLANGKALFDVLAAVDGEHFQNPHAADGDASTSYVLKLGTLRRLYKLMLQYYTDSLSLSPDSLPSPALDDLARSSSPPHAEICKLCRLAIGITVNSEKTKADHIAAIQSLSEAEQGKLMVAIDAIMSATKPSGGTRRRVDSSGEDVDGASAAASSAALAAANKARAELEATYLSLADSHATLKTAHEDLQSERDSLSAELTQLRSERTRSQTFGVDAVLRDELDSLRSQLRKSENQLAEAEAEVERLSAVQRDQTKKLSDLETRADEATKLKDQLDEYRHLASKAQRTENALEKYKKRLEEASGLRRQLKDLESQNTSLVDRNASLEGECARLSESKPLVEHYKVRVEEVEERNRRLEEEVATQRYNLEQTTQEVKALQEARGRDAEMMSTWQERAQELELSATSGTGDSSPRRDDSYDGAFNDDDGDVDVDLKKSLDGATTTNLKLRIHSLTRDLKRARGGDGSRVSALEKLLDDAQRSRKRYEDDYWTEYRARLKLAGDLERIRKAAGEKSGAGVGEKESALALRLRLDEVEEELAEERKRFEEARGEFERTEKELAVARSDLSLIGRDQTSILSTLRASVASENSALASQLSATKADLAHSREAHATLSDRIQALLMDKIALLDGGKGGGGSQQAEEIRAALLAFTNSGGKGGKGEGDGENAQATRRKLEALQERFAKAKLFIKEQDKLLREARATRPPNAPSTSSSSDAGSLDDGGAAAVGGDEMSLRKELEAVKMERDYMMGAWWHMAAKMQQPSTTLPKGDGRGAVLAGAGEGARSWLGQQQRRGTTVAWALGRR